MPSTAVVADTTSYLTPELIAQNDVHLVSLYVGIEGEQDRESDIQDLHAFYERLRASDQQVTTSQPSVGDSTCHPASRAPMSRRCRRESA
jgi:fatty acid-binding protein DegV